MFGVNVTEAKDFLLVCLGIAALLWGGGKLIPHVFRFVKDLVEILWGEFRRGRKKTTIEILDGIFVVGLLVLCIATCLLELGPSATEQSLGANPSGPSKSGQHFHLCLVFFFSMCIISPLWILLDRYEGDVRALIRRSLSRHQP